LGFYHNFIANKFTVQLTTEQHAIINSIGDIKINAVAGSGKTTTIIEYAASRPAHSKILYLAFNKSVKIEAIKKFADKGLKNVKVETAHSLAYKHIVISNNFKVKAQGYKTNEIADMLGLQGNGEKHYEYVVANHINKFISYFCNSDKQKIQELNYLDIVSDAKAKVFIKNCYPFLERQTRLLLAKMNSGEIEITHDFYLKKFQLANPILYYDYILFDEGQDASAAMLDVFFKQQATKVIVGDTHQQIYGWRHAVNSLEKADFTTFNLSTSFRFGADIAKLAMGILQWKDELEDYKPLLIKGSGNSNKKINKAVIARTNLGLLLKAIEYVTEKNKVKQLYFEGNINSYTYADDGASLYDVLNLYNGKRHLIRDSLIKAMKNIEELEEYIEKAEDVQLAMMVEIVKEYGNEIPDIIKSIKDKHVPNDEKEKADVVFSTVHRCKGMEYDEVELVNDFINESKVEKAATDNNNEALKNAKTNEEINLLYVAVTRTKNMLHYPEMLLPKGFPTSTNINIIKPEEEQEQKNNKQDGLKNLQKAREKAYSVPSIRDKHKDAFKPWKTEDDVVLKKLFNSNKTIIDIANQFGRTKGAIFSRLKKLGLAE
jgi:F-box protein, helicase, 18